jgi:hypothetical protein
MSQLNLDLIIKEAPQALTSTYLDPGLLHKYYLERWGNAPEHNPVSGGAATRQVYGALRQRVTVRVSA